MKEQAVSTSNESNKYIRLETYWWNGIKFNNYVVTKSMNQSANDGIYQPLYLLLTQWFTG